MLVNSFKEFREMFKQERINLRLECYHPDYIGTCHEGVYGFFSMYHGEKNDVPGFLQADLNMAEDDQAIYEFLQNAVDCKATLFSTYYDENSFFVLNNGSQFNKDGIISILNIGQSTKRSAESIGRLGIGFKLAHRLVGKQNGLSELLNEYKGPIVFSWNKFEQLKAFLSDENISVADDWKEGGVHLFKILITNFPVGVGEKVYDLDYNQRILFSTEELDEMRSYVKLSLGDIDDKADYYQHGTITFLRLGEGKSRRLDNCIENLENGIQYSMNLFNTLTDVVINGEYIRKKDLIVEKFTIDKGTVEFNEIEPEYKDYDIQSAFGFPVITDYSDDGLEEIHRLLDSPNFYRDVL